MKSKILSLIPVGITVLLILSVLLDLAIAEGSFHKFHSEYPKGTTAYLCDTTAYLHSDWSDTKVRDYVMLDIDEFNLKYNSSPSYSLYIYMDIVYIKDLKTGKMYRTHLDAIQQVISRLNL